MHLITAPEAFPELACRETSVFLGGGITNCPDWQQEVIGLLAEVTTGTLFNPRRSNFPIGDPDAARAQITWEFRALDRADIFSMWFCAGPSDQPICMYELGRHLARRSPTQILIGIEPGYRREADVRIQTELVNAELANRISNNLTEHAFNIRQAVLAGR